VRPFDAIIDCNWFVNIYLLEANKLHFVLKLTLHLQCSVSDKKLFVIALHQV
jgi:hypothetical protein